MRRAITVAILLLAFCLPAFAGGTLVLTDAGYQTMTAEPGQPAVLSPVTPVDHVMDLRTGAPAPNPPPGGDDPPPNTSTFTQNVSTWAGTVNDPNGVAVMNLAYTTIRDNIQRGVIPADPASVDKALTEALNRSLDMMDVADPQQRRTKWAEFRGKVAEELGKRVIANGGSYSKEQFVSFFGEVTSGLETANAGYALPVWVAEILAVLLPVLVRLITGLFSGAG